MDIPNKSQWVLRNPTEFIGISEIETLPSTETKNPKQLILVDFQLQAMERKHPGVRFVHLDILFDMTVQVYRYRLNVDDSSKKL